jgi:hypothetical protein
MSPLLYDVFLSYSHEADGRFAPQLQAALGKMARPWYRRRAVRVFRDQTTLTATPELWPSIRRALAQSRFFLLLASPEAAQSPWVDQELRYWLSLQQEGEKPPAERLLIALTGGTIFWAAEAGDFDWSASNALPPALKGAFRAEPLYVDFSWARSARSLSLKHKPWFDNVAKLAAAVRDMPLDDLIGEDLRQHRISLASAIAATVFVVALGAAALSSWRTADVLRTEKRHQTDIERVLPQVAGKLDRVRRNPIRELEIALDPRDFFRKAPGVLELRLDLDPLWTQPMSFYFAPFVEGRTWPKTLGLNEPTYWEFSHGEPRIDGRFRWFDRNASLQKVSNATFAGGTPRLMLKLDGEEFTPGGALHLPQRYEIPSLQHLLDQNARFRLFRHDPVSGKATELPPVSAGIALRATAYFADAGDARWVLLFDTEPSALARDVAASDYLVHRDPIERNALLNFYPPLEEEPAAAYKARAAAVARLLETRKVTTDDERRALARALFLTGRESAYSGDDLTALRAYVDARRLMEPLVFDRKPAFEDGERMFESAIEPVAYFLNAKKFSRANDFLPMLTRISARMAGSDPSEPQYLRWRAASSYLAARLAVGTAHRSEALTALQDGIEAMREVNRRVDNSLTRADLAQTLEEAVALSEGKDIDNGAVTRWRNEARSLRREMKR